MNGEIALRKALWQEAFSDPDSFVDCFFDTAFSPRRSLCIWEGKELAAAAYWFDCSLQGQKLAYIYAVATAKKARGRGLCRQLMETIHRQLAARGYAGSLLVPGSGALGEMYEKMGYRFFGGKTEFSCLPASAVALKALTAEEFALLRRERLPSGGVVQEEENLTFLAQNAAFAAGDDFLLAYTWEGNCLVGLELLGNREAAAGILAALGATEGRFRTAGSEVYAMFRPIGQTSPPSYFGFAFD